MNTWKKLNIDIIPQLTSSDNFVCWKYSETLYNLDKNHPANARVCPKITSRPVILDNTSKMRVRLATQVRLHVVKIKRFAYFTNHKFLIVLQIFSNSVADGLAFYLAHKCDEFAGCEETIAFCRRCNVMFDALNRKSPNKDLKPDSADFKVQKLPNAVQLQIKERVRSSTVFIVLFNHYRC